MPKPNHFLIVDDEVETLKILQDYLELMGHMVECAHSGTEALQKLSSKTDLVLLDVKMPGMDGFEVARRIRKESKVRNIPIIMVTALGSTEDRLNAVKAGANDFISKPVDVTELEVRTQFLLEMKEYQDQIKCQWGPYTELWLRGRIMARCARQ